MHIFLEIFWIIGFKILENKEHTEKYQHLLWKLVSKKLIEKEIILQRLDERHLIGSKLLNKSKYEKRYRRIQVRGKLEQNKYNLFREENEGYSKLITELLQGNNIITQNLKIVKQNIFSLIGYFDIDPNRALDVILTAYEFYP